MIPLMVVLGALIGAPLRYLTDLHVSARTRSAFPWGVLTVNVVGSLILGVLTGLAPGERITALIGTGFCGALTTFSTFGYATVDTYARGRRAVAAGYVLLSLILGLAAAALGHAAAG
ncbi:fluoride efflux transporter CrcB [Embleya scabrispora]|uniref:fluoride efflux transporter CrcB n=1 Tax=Embleya scabrispora TaxID=159449 RepID=UPI0003679C19|nr:fluoride efflux transporter CrcB [Embleya scabrispora]MYS79539.1 fluoride efflux transporter CrcB [Streptomyces sp. SID5474]